MSTTGKLTTFVVSPGGDRRSFSYSGGHQYRRKRNVSKEVTVQQLSRNFAKLTPQQREIVRFRVIERARLAAHHVAETYRAAGMPEKQAQRFENSIQTTIEVLMNQIVPVQLETGGNRDASA